MADSIKKVVFDFDDKGSLRKVKSMYDEFIKTMAQSSRLYSQNSFGNPAIQQQKFLRDELNLLKEIQKQRKADFEERKNQLNQLIDKENIIYERQKAGLITGSRAEYEFDQISKQRKQILSGTGYRKEETFIKGVGSEVASQDLLISKIEKTLSESNVILRSILANDKETALKEIKAIEESSESTPEQMLAAQHARAVLENKDERKSNRVHDLLSFDNIRGGLSHIKSIATANDAMGATRSFVGAASAGVNAIGDAFGPIGGAIARVITTAGEIAFEQSMQTFQARSDFERAAFANRALFGNNQLITRDVSNLGMSYTDFTASLNPLARARGSSRNIGDIGYSSLLLEKGLGVDNSTIQQLLEVTRTNSETDKNIEEILNDILNQGRGIFQNDRTFLNEFVNKHFIGLQKQLLSNQSQVSSRNVISTLSMLGAIGGQFDPRHQNSFNIYSSINQALSNPQGDALDALTFTALRQQMPGASLGDILIERQKGINSPNYLKAVLNMIGNMGGSETNQMLQVSSAFGINYESARDLVRNRNKINNWSDSAIVGYLGSMNRGEFEQEAQRNVPQIDKINADFMNSILEGQNFQAAVKAIKDVLMEALTGKTFTYNAATNTMVEQYLPVQNKSKIPKQLTWNNQIEYGRAVGESLKHLNK